MLERGLHNSEEISEISQVAIQLAYHFTLYIVILNVFSGIWPQLMHEIMTRRKCVMECTFALIVHFFSLRDN